MRSATVVLPVPGLPVKGHVQRRRAAGASPSALAGALFDQQQRRRCRRIRVSFTGARPIELAVEQQPAHP
jgi:hypothetical protein